jgi:phage I-like protein
MKWLRKLKNRLFINRDRDHETTHTLPVGFYAHATVLPDDADAWIRIVPLGDFPNHYYGAHEVTRAHLEQMLANFQASDCDVLFDVDHRSLFYGDSRAAGWSGELEVRDDGLYCRYPEWTAYGQPFIEAREYRYISPVYSLYFEDSKGHYRGALLDSVALTNRPNLQWGEIDVIGNSAPGSGATPPGKTPIRPTLVMNEELKNLLGLNAETTQEQYTNAVSGARTLLGLAADVDDKKVLNALKSARTHVATPEPTPVIPTAEGDSELTKAITALNKRFDTVEAKLNARDQADADSQAETLINQAVADGKILPRDRTAYLNSARADFAGTKAELDKIKVNSAMPRRTVVREGGKQPMTGFANSVSSAALKYVQEKAAV